MEKESFTVGELAKEMKVSVRTLQYYDKINLLKPYKRSDGNRRLYTNKDKIQLHQILALKFLGFSLDYIRNQIFSLDTPEEVLNLLEQQLASMHDQANDLQSAISTMEKMIVEVKSMGTVDFHKYADIISMIRNNNENYWVVRCFSDKMMNHIRSEFEDNPQEGTNIYQTYERLLNRVCEYKKRGVDPNSDAGIALGKAWWDMVMQFTKGDMSILPQLEEFNRQKQNWNTELAMKQAEIDTYMGKIIQAYFIAYNINTDGMEFDEINN